MDAPYVTLIPFRQAPGFAYVPELLEGFILHMGEAMSNLHAAEAQLPQTIFISRLHRYFRAQNDPNVRSGPAKRGEKRRLRKTPRKDSSSSDNDDDDDEEKDHKPGGGSGRGGGGGGSGGAAGGAGGGHSSRGMQPRQSRGGGAAHGGRQSHGGNSSSKNPRSAHDGDLIDTFASTAKEMGGLFNAVSHPYADNLTGPRENNEQTKANAMATNTHAEESPLQDGSGGGQDLGDQCRCGFARHVVSSQLGGTPADATAAAVVDHAPAKLEARLRDDSYVGSSAGAGGDTPMKQEMS